MHTDDLIANLSAEFEPSRKGPQVGLWFGLWLLFAVGALVAGLVITETNPKFEILWQRPQLIMETVALLSVALIAGFGAVMSTIPGRTSTVYLATAATLGLLVWGGIVAARLFFTGGTVFPPLETAMMGHMCGAEVALVGLFPSLGLFALMRKGAPTRLWISGALSLAAGLCLAAVLIQARCADGNLLHYTLWHVGPVLVATGIGAVLGRVFLRW